MSASQQLTLPSIRRECLSETVGTYLLVFFGPASVVLASTTLLTPFQAQEAIAGVFGLTVALVITFLGGISGAQINPAVTVAIAGAGRLGKDRFIPYVLSQIAGALLAGLSLAVVFQNGGAPTSLGSTKLAPSVSPLEGVLLEVAGTLVLALSALTAGSFLRTNFSQGILVGSTLFVLITLIGPLTGASFNPARSLGPTLFSGYFDNQFVYYIGPILGGIAAGLIFRMIRRPGKME
ncbi:MAG: aquaporin [Thaumarchaeota archaeon]|nr:aquaporin [Nitrososphaerota archaeon]